MLKFMLFCDDNSLKFHRNLGMMVMWSRGATGINLIPNLSFWVTLPLKIKVSCHLEHRIQIHLYTYRRCCCVVNCQALSISLSLNLSLSLRDRDRADTIITFHHHTTNISLYSRWNRISDFSHFLVC